MANPAFDDLKWGRVGTSPHINKLNDVATLESTFHGLLDLIDEGSHGAPQNLQYANQAVAVYNKLKKIAGREEAERISRGINVFEVLRCQSKILHEETIAAGHKDPCIATNEGKLELRFKPATPLPTAVTDTSAPQAESTGLKKTRSKKKFRVENFVLDVPTENRFEALSDKEDDEVDSPSMEVSPPSPAAADTTAVPVPRKSPPIFVESKENPAELIAAVIEATGTDYTFKVSGAFLKIVPNSPDHYHAIVKLLGAQRRSFHTSLLREDRALCVVMRGLHTCSTETEVLEELRAKGFTATKVTQMMTKRQGSETRRLPLFIVSLPKTNGNADIMKMTSLLHQKVEVKRFKPSAGPTQCFRCQRFGHGSSACHMGQRCVKCGESHRSSDCTRPKTEAATCCNCGGGHTASHRLCPARVKQAKPKRSHPPAVKSLPAKPKPAVRPTPTVQPGISFADKVAGRKPENKIAAAPEGFTAESLLSSPKLPQILATFRELATVLNGESDGMEKTAAMFRAFLCVQQLLP